MELSLIVFDECCPINQRHAITACEIPLRIFVCCVVCAFTAFKRVATVETVYFSSKNNDDFKYIAGLANLTYLY